MTLKTLDNALLVLKYFTKENPTWGVRDLAKEMAMNHTVVYRILSTFKEHGFLVQNHETNKYELGLKLLEYVTVIQQHLNISDVIYPVMKRLAAETEESAFLTWLDGTEGVYLEIVESPKSIKFAVSVGSRAPLYVGASNKIMMAFLPEDMQKKIIEKGLQPITNNTITNENELRKDLQQIRLQGWCHSTGEYSDDVTGLAIPLFNDQNSVIASLTLAGPGYRFTSKRIKELLPHLKQKGSEIQDYFYKMPMNHYRGIQ
jgi:DNA-binding IclR family transcriptional regulator